MRSDKKKEISRITRPMKIISSKNEMSEETPKAKNPILVTCPLCSPTGDEYIEIYNKYIWKTQDIIHTKCFRILWGTEIHPQLIKDKVPRRASQLNNWIKDQAAQ